MITYSIANDTVLIVNSKKIDFKHNISNIVEVGGLLIVHTFDSIEKKGSIKMSEQPLNGVFAVDSNGELQWNIKDIIPNDEMYTNISMDDNGDLVLNTFMGIAQIVDITAKKVVGKSITK